MIGLLEEHVRNPGDLVTKARIYDEAVAKIGSVTALKLIQICVDYSAKMETILAEMRALFAAQNHFFWGSPVSLEKVSDLTEFPDLPLTEVLQNLQTLTTPRTNQESTESGEGEAPGSNAKTYEAKRVQLEEVPTPASVSTTVPETPISVLTTISETPVPPHGSGPSNPVSPNSFPHTGKSGTKYVHAHSTPIGNCKGVCGVYEKGSSLHTDTQILGAVEEISRRYTSVTTTTPIPSSGIGF